MTTFLRADWQNIIMVNYVVDKNLLLPYLPYGVELDFYNDQPFISLVGFKFANSKIAGVPIPLFGSFDEVNLRFYVQRKADNKVKRGVVFISEIVPHKIVSLLANKLYKEHYTTAKMSSIIAIKDQTKNIKYTWQRQSEIYAIDAAFSTEQNYIKPNSLEEFIYEHYYGFTKVSATETWEYKVNHPNWQTNKLKSAKVICNFKNLYGDSFEFLNHQEPFSVYNAVGSNVSIDWKINKIVK
ncbi:MAG: DUF2071 domain-containing protein [Chitinophagaceae bacterium]